MPRAPDLAGVALDDRYELREMLGEGAFGRVYRGLDRRLGREVAVKVIKPWWAEDSAWVERFRREARLLARVSDPGVVQIYDIGDAEEGPYYVAELVEGESLADRLDGEPLPPEQARAIAAQLCRALASAHREGVVHCDIKPANVLLAADGGVKVGDFGVARLAEGSSQLPSPTVAGTPRYMAPEQARGRPPTAATDVYSVGVVLYEMLAGAPPFRDGSPVELGLRHLEDPPPPLPTTVPPELCEVVARALAKDPADRYRDAGQMSEALEAAGAARRAAPGAPNGAARRAASAPVPVAARAASADDRAATAVVSRKARGARGAAGAAAPTVARTRLMGDGGPPRGGGRGQGEDGRRRRRGLIAAVAGALVLAAAAIAAFVLSGQTAMTTVPQLLRLPRGGVEARARRLHVTPAFSARHSELAAGLALAQAPPAGARVAQGSTVHVVLSSGPPPVNVPGVVGETAAAAERQIASAGLRYGTALVPGHGTQAGVVVSQSPGASASAPRGSTVTLSVAEAPRWHPLTTFSGTDDGESVPFQILGRRWRVTYGMSFNGTCLLLLVCEGPSAQARNVDAGSSAGGFELEEGESQTHVFATGPGLYRIKVSGGRDSARWSMTVEDYD
jgi:serine/threonine-protein kinase